MAVLAGCGTDVDGTETESESTVCSSVGTSWWNRSFTDQTGTFHVEFSATPSRNNIDAVVGLSNGSASAWTKLAAIVRFNPDGFIDARNGGVYTAVQQESYAAGTTFWIRIDVDVRNHKYSAWASPYQGQFGSWNQIADNYSFRTEQASVTHLNNLAGFVNTTTPGSLQVCGFAVNALPPGGTTCVASNAGGGFVNVATVPGLHGMIVNFDAAPSQANMDGVVGVALGAVDDYNDMAAAVRFYTNGVIEARDGDTYRAASSLPYAAGQVFSFKLVIDLENKTYTVFAHPQYSDQQYVIAENWKFRTQQAGVSQLDHVATIVATSTGSVNLCNPRSTAPDNLRYARFGNPQLAPIGDGVIVSGLNTGTNQTVKYDVNGKLLGSPGFGIGGEPAVDASGNLYLASLSGTTLTVQSYSPAFSRRWTASVDAEGGSVLAAAVTGGNIVVAVRHSGDVLLERFSTSTGAFQPGERFMGQPVIGLGGGGWATAYAQTAADGSIIGASIYAYAPDRTLRWYKSFAGNFYVEALAVGPDGSVVFGGEFNGQTANFGDFDMHTIGNSEEGPFNGYFVALSPTGALRYSAQTGADRVNDIDTDGSSIAVANHHFTQMEWVDFGVYDTTGHGLAGCGECDVGLGHQGSATKLSVASHRVYLNVDEQPWWPGSWDRAPFMFAFDF